MPSRQASSDKKQLDVGANLFIGSLDDNVDERLLYDTFSAFGVMSTTAKVSTSADIFPPSSICKLSDRWPVIPQPAHRKVMASSLSPTSSLRMLPSRP